MLHGMDSVETSTAMPTILGMIDEHSVHEHSVPGGGIASVKAEPPVRPPVIKAMAAAEGAAEGAAAVINAIAAGEGAAEGIVACKCIIIPNDCTK